MVKKNVKRFTNTIFFWNEDFMLNDMAFDGVAQFYTHKTMTSLKGNAFVASLPYNVFPNITHDLFTYVTDNGYMFSGLHPVSTALAGQDESEQVSHRFLKSQLHVVDLSDILSVRIERDTQAAKSKVLYVATEKTI